MKRLGRHGWCSDGLSADVTLNLKIRYHPEIWSFVGRNKVAKVLSLKHKILSEPYTTSVLVDLGRLIEFHLWPRVCSLGSKEIRTGSQQIVYSYESDFTFFTGFLKFERIRNRGIIILHKPLGCEQEEVRLLELIVTEFPEAGRAPGRPIHEAKSSILWKAFRMTKSWQAYRQFLKSRSLKRWATEEEMASEWISKSERYWRATYHDFV